MNEWRKLLIIFAFMGIRGPFLSVWKYWIPMLFSVAVLLSSQLLPDVNVLGSGGIIESVNSLLGVLIGFYIASLTAIASLKADSLDESLGDDYTFPNWVTGRRIVTVTRRVFLSALFGFASVMSFICFGVGFILRSFTCSALEKLFGSKWFMATNIFCFGYSLILSSLISATLLGLYYLVFGVQAAEQDCG